MLFNAFLRSREEWGIIFLMKAEIYPKKRFLKGLMMGFKHQYMKVYYVTICSPSPPHLKFPSTYCLWHSSGRLSRPASWHVFHCCPEKPCNLITSLSFFFLIRTVTPWGQGPVPTHFPYLFPFWALDFTQSKSWKIIINVLDLMIDTVGLGGKTNSYQESRLDTGHNILTGMSSGGAWWVRKEVL